MQKIHHANHNHKKAGVTSLILDKTDTETAKITREEKEHFIMMIKGSTHQEDIIIINIYTQHSPKYIKQDLPKWK